MVDVTVNMNNIPSSVQDFLKNRNHELIPQKKREKEYFLNKQQLMQLKKEKNQKRIKDSKKAHRS